MSELVVTNGVEHRPIHAIAADMRQAWGGAGKVYYGAVPYLEAMDTLTKGTDAYLTEAADNILLYLTVNWQTLRGEEARTLKAEVKDILRACGHKIR